MDSLITFQDLLDMHTYLINETTRVWKENEFPNYGITEKLRQRQHAVQKAIEFRFLMLEQENKTNEQTNTKTD